MKRFIMGLVVGVLVATSVSVGANSNIRIFVNGKEIVSDKVHVSDGFTMIPLRAVAEALDASVMWENNVVMITNKKPVQITYEPIVVNDLSSFYHPLPSARYKTTKEIQIQGSPEFISVMEDSLVLLKEKDIISYMFVLDNIKKIVEDEEKSYINVVSTVYNNKLQENIFGETLLAIEASGLIHEATHVWLYKNDYEYKGYDAEAFCNTTQSIFLIKNGYDFNTYFLLVDSLRLPWWD